MIDVRLIDARIRADNAEAVTRDDYAGLDSYDIGRFSQYQLDYAWIFLDSICQLNGFGRRLYIGQKNEAALGQRYYLLRNHDNIAFDQLGVQAAHCGGDQFSKIVADPD